MPGMLPQHRTDNERKASQDGRRRREEHPPADAGADQRPQRQPGRRIAEEVRQRQDRNHPPVMVRVEPLRHELSQPAPTGGLDEAVGYPGGAERHQTGTGAEGEGRRDRAPHRQDEHPPATQQVPGEAGQRLAECVGQDACRTDCAQGRDAHAGEPWVAGDQRRGHRQVRAAHVNTGVTEQQCGDGQSAPQSGRPDAHAVPP